MKQWLCLILLLSLVYAGSALSVDDFEIKIKEGPIKSISPSGTSISVYISLATNESARAFNVVLGFVPLPGLKADKNEVEIEKIENKEKRIWTLYGNGTYDLSNAFKIISWDNSVKLELNITNETDDPNPILSLTTDPADLCKKHKFKGFWGEDENCFTEIFVNSTSQGYANESGSFSKRIEGLTLKKGKNLLVISAVDPGGNVEERNVTIVYNPSVQTYVKENILYIGAFIAIVGALGIFIYIKTKRSSRLKELYRKERELAEKLEKYWRQEARGMMTLVDKSQMEVTTSQLDGVVDEIRSIDRKGWLKRGYELLISLILHNNAFWDVYMKRIHRYNDNEVKEIVGRLRKNRKEVEMSIRSHVKGKASDEKERIDLLNRITEGRT